MGFRARKGRPIGTLALSTAGAFGTQCQSTAAGDQGCHFLPGAITLIRAGVACSSPKFRDMTTSRDAAIASKLLSAVDGRRQVEPVTGRADAASYVGHVERRSFDDDDEATKPHAADTSALTF